MRTLFFIAAFFLLSGLLSGLANADFEIKDPAAVNEEEANSPQGSDYAVEGAGVNSCDTYLSDRKKKSSMHYINLNWAKGFISGVNYIHATSRGNSQLGTGLDLKALTLWLDSYCQDNEAATLSDASAKLVENLIR